MTDPLTAAAAIAAAAVYVTKTGYEYVRKMQNGRKDSGHVVCHFIDPDTAKLRTLEITKEVTDSLGPQIEEQTRLLREIRDAVRELKVQ